jgi:arylsulfatase A
MRLNRRGFMKVAAVAAAGLTAPQLLRSKGAPTPGKPNIVVILADDLGLGDVSCYNPGGKVPTPNLDKLAAEGMRFTDAHTSAASCSPTRYGLITGQYAWRTRLQVGVLKHFEPPLIDKGRLTVASLLKQNGYATAGVGKWHLGWGWVAKPGKTIKRNSWSDKECENVDFTKPLTACPLDNGFDYYFGIGSSNNMQPYCYIENNKVVVPPATKKKHPVYDTESGAGLVSDDYVSEQIDQVLWSKAKGWLDRHFKATPKKPFFLYMPTSAIHRPCLAAKEFRGKSGAGLHGDKVVELDSIVGRLVADLKAKGCLDNTLILFTSDNGALPGDPEGALKKYAKNDWGKQWSADELLKRKSEGSYGSWVTYGHKTNGPWLGYKMTIYEGGHRVPFIVRWPGRIKPGSVSDEIVCTVDLMATVANILEVDLPNDSAEDSYSILPVLQGKKLNKPLREATIMNPWSAFKSIRQGPWKLILADNSGGYSLKRKVDTPGQLYNLAKDPGEKTNIYAKYPEKVKALTAIVKKYESAGRSAPPAKFAE